MESRGCGNRLGRPELLLPETRFQSLDLRDREAEEKFLAQLKTAGVPISEEVTTDE